MRTVIFLLVLFISSNVLAGELRLGDLATFDYPNTWRIAERSAMGSANTMVSTPSPPEDSKTYCMKVAWSKTANIWTSFNSFSPITTEEIKIGFNFQLDNASPTNDMPILQVEDAGSVVFKLQIEDYGVGHQLKIYDANNNLVATDNNFFINIDTWTTVEAYFDYSTSGNYDVSRNGLSQMSGSGEDFLDTFGALQVTLDGEGGNEPATTTNCYFSSMYALIGGNGGVADYLDDWDVITWQVSKNAVTPDCDENGTADAGDNLTSNNWDDTSDGTTTAAQYAGEFLLGGACKADGPAGDIAWYEEPIGSKWIWFMNGSATSGQTHVVYGKFVDPAYTVIDASTTITRLNKPWNVIQDHNKPSLNRSPDPEETFVIGFTKELNIGASITVNAEEMWCSQLYKEPVDAYFERVATVHIDGNTHIAGNTQIIE